MGRIEFWTSGVGIPTVNVRQASRAEAEGWDGIVYVDSQNLSGDCYIALALAAKATERLKLGTGVTNPYTRHPAVTASAIATVQAESSGRAHLGIGRGDSALAHLGVAPAPLAAFERYLRRLQGYLRGEDVEFEESAKLAALRLANAPTASRIEWLRPSQAKVPVDVAATGPKVIRIAALLADRVSLAVGGDPVRIRWAIDLARETRRAAGMDPNIAFGAYVPCVVHDDPGVARQLGEGSLSLFSRFSAMHGRAVGPVSPMQRDVLEQVHDAYDMTRHAQAGSPQTKVLTTEFARSFGIFGPPAHCIDRLRELVDLGVDVFHIAGPAAGADRREAERAHQRFLEEVVPAVREP